MEFTLDAESREYIEAAVAAGDFDTPSDALNAAVAELRRRTEYRDYVRNAVAESMASLERGEGTVYGANDTSRLAEEIKAEARARCAASARKVARASTYCSRQRGKTCWGSGPTSATGATTTGGLTL